MSKLFSETVSVSNYKIHICPRITYWRIICLPFTSHTHTHTYTPSNATIQSYRVHCAFITSVLTFAIYLLSSLRYSSVSYRPYCAVALELNAMAMDHWHMRHAPSTHVSTLHTQQTLCSLRTYCLLIKIFAKFNNSTFELCACERNQNEALRTLFTLSNRQCAIRFGCQSEIFIICWKLVDI